MVDNPQELWITLSQEGHNWSQPVAPVWYPHKTFSSCLVDQPAQFGLDDFWVGVDLALKLSRNFPGPTWTWDKVSWTWGPITFPFDCASVEELKFPVGTSSADLSSTRTVKTCEVVLGFCDWGVSCTPWPRTLGFLTGLCYSLVLWPWEGMNSESQLFPLWNGENNSSLAQLTKLARWHEMMQVKMLGKLRCIRHTYVTLIHWTTSWYNPGKRGWLKPLLFS